MFSGDTPVATAVAHVQNAPIPPGLRSEFKIPPALEGLIMECLAKDPAARPASAAVMSERLAATVQPDAWTLDAARAWWERHQPLTRFRAAGAAVEEPTLDPLVVQRSCRRHIEPRISPPVHEFVSGRAPKLIAKTLNQ